MFDDFRTNIYSPEDEKKVLQGCIHEYFMFLEHRFLPSDISALKKWGKDVDIAQVENSLLGYSFDDLHETIMYYRKKTTKVRERVSAVHR